MDDSKQDDCRKITDIITNGSDVMIITWLSIINNSETHSPANQATSEPTMNPRRQAHCALAALMVVGALTACASGSECCYGMYYHSLHIVCNHACRTEWIYVYIADQIGSISPQPMDQTAMVGEQVLFQCQYTEKELVPIWRINTVEYIPSTLPPGHWINSSGLVVSVQEEMNGNTYQCQFKVFLSDSNGFFTPSSKQASLTVPSSTGECPDGNLTIHSIKHTILLSLVLIQYVFDN